MKQSIGIYVLTVLLIAVGFTQAGIHFPPFYRENPNERSIQPKADDPNYRLPNDTTPISYKVELTTNVHNGEKDFQGIVEIEIVVNVTTQSIVLHARQLENFVPTVREVGTTVEQPLKFDYDEDREFLILTLVDTSVNLNENTHYIVTIKYNGQLRTDNGGFYLSTFEDADGVTRYLATTQFESTDARHAFPCYDEPAKRATFTIIINHDPSYHAISNMPINEADSSPGKTVFDETVRMSTYLLAFIVSDFKFTEGVLNQLPQRIYSRPGTEHDQEWALVSGLLISQRLTDYYNVSYALPKLDQAAIPDFAAGAMENWGLATYREEYLLYNKDHSTINTQTNIANIIAHEYCHMWFGDLVSIEWWTYLWLKEGFATLFSYQATDDAYPEWGVWQQFHTDDYQRALNNDASNSPRAMTHYVQKPSEISRLYDSVSYSKGGSVLSMFQHALGDAVFRRGLHNYLSWNQFSSGNEDDLFNAIQVAAKEQNIEVHAQVPAMMKTWTNRGGYPLLTVERNYNSGSFVVKQRPFYIDQNKTDDYKWYIPFNYMDASNWDFRDTLATHFITNSESEISVEAKLDKDDWLILNKQSSSYYRINYDETNWQLIIEGLKTKPNRVHPRNRAQLMHDAYRFMSSDILDHEILLSLMTYLENENQYAPWSTANGIITVFNLFLSGDSDYTVFKNFVANLVSNIYENLGVNDIPGEQHFQKYTRNIAINVACLVGVDSCLQETNNKLKDLINKNIEIEPNLQSPIYCNGLRQSGSTEFNYVYDKLMDSSDQAQRRLLISSLGCSQSSEQIKKFVSSSIDMSNKLRTQERTTLLSSAYARGEVGLLTSIEFLNDNWEAYGKLTSGFGGSNPLDNDIRGMSQYVVNENQKSKLKELVDKVKGRTDMVTETLEASVDTNINTNFVWLSKNRSPILEWIKSYSKSGSSSVTGSLLTVVGALLVTLVRYF